MGEKLDILQLEGKCHLKNIPVNENDLKLVLGGNIKAFIQENVKPIIISLAEEAGHMVVWSPPHHSDLQPIELVWANVKGTVVGGCSQKANNHLQHLLEHILAMENIVEDSDNDTDDDSSKDGITMST
eukprot:7332515-Ditylum_brightwellii.AAC.1